MSWNGINGRESARYLQWMIMTLCLLLPGMASGLGLGDITVESYLNQPFRATIAINTRPGENLSGLEVSEAPSEDYQRLGLTYSLSAIPLQFEVVDGSNGPTVRVTSELPVRDPVMQIAAEARWSKGRLLRPYTVFLDPATTAAAAQPRRTEQPSVTAEPASEPEPAPASQTEPVASGEPETAGSRDQVQPGDPSGIESGEFGPVRSGQTLWSIASRARGNSGVSVNRYMLAIQRLNPEAFNNGNINSLKRGAILRLPQTADLQGIGDSEATAEVLAQEQAWRDGLTRPSPASLADSDNTPALDPAGRTSSEAESDAPAEEAERTAADDSRTQAPAEESDQQQLADTDTETTDEPAGELRLVPPSDDDLLDEADAAEQGDAELRERLARTEEDLINANAENAVLQDRLTELEGNRQPGDTAREADQAVGVQDQALADLQDEIRRQRQQDARNDAATAGEQAGAEGVGTADTGTSAVESQPAEARQSRQRADSGAPFWKSPWLWLVVILAGLLITGFLWMRSRSEAADEASGGSFMDRMFEEEDARAAGNDEDSVAALQQDAEDLLRELDEDREMMQDEGFAAEDQGTDELESDGPVERHEGAAAAAALTEDDSGDPVSESPESEDEQPEDVGVESAVESDDAGMKEDDEHPGSLDVDEDWARDLEGESEPEPAAEADPQAGEEVDDPFAASLQGDTDADDAGFSDEDVPEGEDSVEVKLDLARAYVGMDDREAAEAILEEVIADGNEDQQAEARRMLENL